MEPTLYTNDVLVMERISVRLQRLKKGDIVISKCPTNPKQNICKRIVGLPGDNIRNGLNITTVNFIDELCIYYFAYIFFLFINHIIINHNLQITLIIVCTNDVYLIFRYLMDMFG